MAMRDLRPAARVPLLILGMLSLLGGVLAGLARLGWGTPSFTAGASAWHGALMVSAFLGTVISLERAVALGRGWAYLAPAAAGIGGLALLTSAPLLMAQVLGVGGASILVAASAKIMRRLMAPFTIILAIGSLCWFVGNTVWMSGSPLTDAVPWWLSFLVLTIAGERLEINRFLPMPPVALKLFFITIGVILLGALISLRAEDAGLRLFSVGLLALAVWLLRYDIARRNSGQPGLTGFIAHCLLSGYVWLMLAGMFGLAGGFEPGHPWRDATLHAVGLGFVFSMIFGHAPIILPAVARVRLLYHPFFYIPLAVLHASLVLRIFGGLDANFPLRSEGGLLNAIALLLFIATIVVSVVRGSRETAGQGAA